MLPALTALDLSYTTADDDVMRVVSRLKKLSLLAMMHCRQITDTGILWFTSMLQLRNVYLDGCNHTTEAVKHALQQIMPQLNLINYCF